ncbi:MAG: glycosyltransferase [Spirochaetia bacterium]|jgi:1,2-diacylglycerol 3-alpha-glucosyltransferase
MNIALFTDTFFPVKNGVVTHVNELKEGLRRRGHTVFIVTSRFPDYEDDDPAILRLTSLKVPLGKGMQIRYAFGLQKTVTDFLKNKNIQIVHTHTEFSVGRSGVKSARHLGIPHVHTLHTMWEEYRHYIFNGRVLTRGMIKRALRWFLKRVDAFVAPSPKSAHYLQALMPSVPVSVISNGVDTTRIASLIPSAEQKAALRAQLGVGTDDFILIFVGRIGMEKRVFELVDAVAAAAAREPRIRMIFIGDGPTLDPLKRRAQDSAAPAAFVFTGFLGWEAVIAHLASSNLFVTVSLSEVQPMTIIEAQLCGLPVVARRDESYFEMILDGKNGYLVEEDSEVVEKILELARDERKWADFSRESLRRSQNLSIENTVSRMEELYGTLISSRGAGTPSRK